MNKIKDMIIDLLSIHGQLSLEEILDLLSYYQEAAIMAALDKLETEELISQDIRQNFYLV